MTGEHLTVSGQPVEVVGESRISSPGANIRDARGRIVGEERKVEYVAVSVISYTPTEDELR